MSKELVAGIKAVAADRGLDADIIFKAIETALVSTYKNRNGILSNIVAQVDRYTGESRVFVEKEVAEEVLDDRTMISESDAQELDPKAQLGDLVLVEFTPKDISRIALQSAKQGIMQRIREAERDVIYETFKDQVGELITAQVRSVDSYSNAVTVTVNDRSEFVLQREDQIPNNRLRRGDYVKLYVERVEKDNRGPYVKVSRTHRKLLLRLLEQEIPELREGTIEVKNIVREPGARSKVAVHATVENVDPVGSCVGMKGIRIKNIVSELAGERIDIVEWSDEPHTYIIHAISPAVATGVILHEDANNRTATVVAADDQLSLAIGKSGQNARLAARLTGWRIDIKSETEAQAEGIDLFELQQNMMRHDQLAMASRRLAATQLATGDPLDRAARLIEQQDSTRLETEQEDILRDALQDAVAQQPPVQADPWEAAQEAAQSSESLEQDGADDVFRQAAQETLKQMSYEEFTESHDAGLRQAEEVDVDETETEKDQGEPLPDVITADMLQARKRRDPDAEPLSLDEIEVPAELLAGYEEDDGQVNEKLSENSPKRNSSTGNQRTQRRTDSPDATRFNEDWLDE